MSKEAIQEALLKLDTENAEHWTADSLPKVEALGIEGLKRKDITEAAPHFTRDNPTIDTPAVKAEPVVVPKTLEDRLKEAAEEVNLAHKAAYDANQRYNKAIGLHDMLTREAAAIHGQRNSQHDIMDYLASQRKLREEQAK